MVFLQFVDFEVGYTKIHYNQLYMKLLLAAAFAFTAYTQQLPNLSSNG